jgi:hypothetical protein
VEDNMSTCGKLSLVILPGFCLEPVSERGQWKTTGQLVRKFSCHSTCLDPVSESGQWKTTGQLVRKWSCHSTVPGWNRFLGGSNGRQQVDL